MMMLAGLFNGSTVLLSNSLRHVLEHDCVEAAAFVMQEVLQDEYVAVEHWSSGSSGLSGLGLSGLVGSGPNEGGNGSKGSFGSHQSNPD